jgi:hypothetical protein
MTRYILFLPFFVFLLAGNSAWADDYFVSPNGSDSDPGTLEKPFRTIAAAQAAVRRDAERGRSPITVYLRDGTYHLSETVVFTPDDSGTEAAPVTYAAYNDEKPVISGGSEIQLNWKPFRDGIMQATTPAGTEIDQLFVDGTLQRMARYPNYDPDQKALPYQGYAADAFSKERAAGWADPTGGYIHAMHSRRWGGYSYRITGKDADGNVTYEGGWQNNRQKGMHREYRMVENIFEELDAPGEWFHNGRSNTLYYYPPNGVDLSRARIETARLAHLFEFRGTFENPVRFLVLKGLKMTQTARTFMLTKEPLLRSDWTIYRGGAVFLEGVENIQIRDSEIFQVGGNAIFVSGYGNNVLVNGCHIHQTGASGVCFVGKPTALRNSLFEYGERQSIDEIDKAPGPKSEEYPRNCAVEDNLIHGIGMVERQPAGVQIAMSQSITVRDCSIYDTVRAGINIGDGTFGGHLIEGCDVFDTVLETHDHGAFNSWGRDRFWKLDGATVEDMSELVKLDAVQTTVIRNSRWRCDHGWDIDLDDGSSNYEIYNNLMLAGGLKLREGFYRKAYNNITVNGGLSPHVWYQLNQDEVTRNIWMRQYNAAGNAPAESFRGVDHNLYTTVSHLEFGRSFGAETHSIVGDPLFVDPKSGDYRVKERSPALTIGFKNFPMDQFGVKKPALKAITRTPELPDLVAVSDSPSRGEDSKSVEWMGARLLSITAANYSAFGVSMDDGGAYFEKVPAGSKAAEAGFQENDVIQKINGKPVSDVKQLSKKTPGAEGSPMEIIYVRDQKEMKLIMKR